MAVGSNCISSTVTFMLLAVVTSVLSTAAAVAMTIMAQKVVRIPETRILAVGDGVVGVWFRCEPWN